MGKRKRKTYAERLLEEARKHPSSTCRDKRQLDLLSYINEKAYIRRAFADLDAAIKTYEENNGPQERG
jgi:hypothetical protein